MSCVLKNSIDHTKIKESFKFCLPCPIFELPHSKSIGAVCSFCCLRISQILEARKIPLFVAPNTPTELLKSSTDEYKRTLIDRLPDYLKEHYEVIPRISGKTWDEVAIYCANCKSGEGEGIVASEAESMEL